MIIKQYSTFLTALVLGFGLISCSQDKDIQYQDDKFEPEPLRLERNDNSLTVIDNLVSMGLNDKLTFNNPTEIDSQQITHLELTTSCQEQFSNEKIVHQSQWPNPTEVHLLNMIPPRVLVKKSTENIFCDIEYTFTNKNNSTSTRTVKNIKFNNDEKFTNLPANHLFASTDDINWSTQQNTSVDLEDRTGGLLHCDDIDITINATTPQSLLKDLIPQEQIQQAEPKSLRQSCRVAFSIHKNIVLSPAFNLILPQDKPRISYSFSSRRANTSLIDEQQKVYLRIINPNSFPISLRWGPTQMVLGARGIIAEGGGIYSTKIYWLPLAWSLDNQLIDTQNPLVLPGNTTTLLTGSAIGRIYSAGRIHSIDYPTSQVTLPSTQNSILGGMLHNMALPIFMGYNLGLSRENFLLLNNVSDNDAELWSTPEQTIYQSGPPQALVHWDLSFNTLRDMRIPYHNVSDLIPHVQWEVRYPTGLRQE